MVCDGRTDGRKKSHIEVGALPKNRSSEKGRIEIEEKKNHVYVSFSGAKTKCMKDYVKP